MRIEPLSDVAGARICDLDLSQPLAADTFAQVEAALHDHCFVSCGTTPNCCMLPR